MTIEIYWDRARPYHGITTGMESHFITCPACGEESVYYNPKVEVSICSKCPHKFDGVVKKPRVTVRI